MTPETRPTDTGEGAPAELIIKLVASCLERLDDLPVEERRSCAEDEIDKVCRAHPDQAADVRERVGILLRAGLAGTDGDQPKLRTLGRYRLVGELGRGGMGVVYLALDPRLGRLVALKALATRLVASEIARTRFDREIKAIAALKHRRIVPIYEVGEAAGVPYFTMEYIEGRTLAEVVSSLRHLDVPTDELNTTHLGEASFLSQASDQHDALDDEDGPAASRDTDHVLPMAWGKTYVETACRLVHDVAEALQHSHEHGVIHRDVKPSNILVASDGRALLFDFGLARMELEETVTLSGDFAGTPYYVAPEQISARGKDVDARSDVYALGVTLYELLTLRRPFEGRNAQVIFRQVLSREAPPPRRFNRLIPRDLDTICTTALEKSPERRYQTAGELAADLRRFLEFRPVQARPIGRATRAGRLARHHPGATIAIGLAVLIAIGLPIALGFYNLRIAAEAGRARDAEARAEREAERAHAVNAFLVEVISSADPEVAGAPELSVRDLLDLSSARVGGSFPGRPDIEAAVRRVIGNSYVALGRYSKALPHLQTALELRRDADEPSPAAIAESLYDLGVLNLRDREFESSEALLTEALELRRRTFEGDHEDLAQSLAGVAALLAQDDRLEEARVAGEDALAMRQRLHGDQHKEVVIALLALGKIALWMDDTTAAETYMRDALRTATGLFGPDDLTVATAQVHLGSLQRTRGVFQEAHDLWQLALVTRTEFLGEDHLLTAQLMVNLSRVARILSQPERAVELARSGLAIQESTLGPTHEELTHGLQNLGMALLALDEFEEGRAALERSIAILRATHGDYHSDVAMALFDLGRFSAEEGNDDGAAVAYAEALDILNSTRGPDSRLIGNTSLLFGEVERRRGELDHAEELLTEALRIHTLHLPRGSPTLLMNEQELGVLLCQRERFEESVPLLERPFEIYTKTHKGLSSASLYVGLWLGRALAGAGRTSDAQAHLFELVAYGDRVEPDGSPELSDVLKEYGDLLLRLERPTEAIPPLERCATMGPRVAPNTLLAHAETRSKLALAYSRVGRHREAESLALEAREQIVELEGERHPSAREALAGIIEVYDSAGREREAARWRERAPAGD